MTYIQLPRRNRGGREYKLVVATARALVQNRLRYFNQFYQCRIGKISIRKQRSRWGSASKSSGNLNFNYRIAYLPPELADYLVVHELSCHLVEANHSSRFWLASRSHALCSTSRSGPNCAGIGSSAYLLG